MLSGRSYRAVSVTLPDHTKSYNLAALLTAVDAAFPLAGREVSLQVNSSVAGTIYVGESGLVTAVNCGCALTTGTSRLYRSNRSDIPLAMLGVAGSVDNVVLNVEVLQ